MTHGFRSARMGGMGDLIVGALLRRLRTQAGRSQAEQAAVLSDLAGRAVTRNEISRWESESRLPTPFWQRHYANSFDNVAVGDILTAVAATKQQRRRDRHTRDSEGNDVQRRHFMGAVAGLAMSLPQVFTASHGSQIGSAQAAQLLARTARLRRLDDFLGGADTYRLYASELAATNDFVRNASCTTPIKQALTAVVAEQAQLAGWAAFDAGLHHEAERHYRASLRAAEEANDASLAGNSLAFLAYQRISVAKPDVGMATASYATAKRSATPKVRALLLERKAWTHAVAGQAKESESALAQASAALHTHDDRKEPDWVFWVDETELGIMAGRCWAELKRPLRAVPTLEDALARYDDTHARDKSMYLTWLAHAYLDAGEIEQAVEVTNRAADLAAGVASARPSQRIDDVRRRLSPYRTVPAVATLLDRLAAG